MIRLMVVEARRALARGVTRLLLIIAVLGLVVTTVWLFVATKSADAIHADEAAAELRAEQDANRSGIPAPSRAASVQRCVEVMSARSAGTATTATTVATVGPGGTAAGAPIPPTTRRPDDWSDVDSGNGTPERIRAYCEAQNGGVSSSAGSGTGPGSSSSRYRSSYYYGPKVFEYTGLWYEKGDGHLLLPASLLFFGGLVAGASLIGSEWQTGSFVTFLTWEPRRARVYLTKALVYAGLAFVIAFVLLILFALALYPTAAIKGSTEGMTSEWFTSVFAAMARMSAITAFAAGVGSALAMIGRRTALALIMVFVYLFIVESLFGVWQKDLRPWLLATNIAVFMTGNDISNEEFSRSTTTAGLTLLAYSAVFVTLAALAFRRRDFASG
jgi:hypothetical protein